MKILVMGAGGYIGIPLAEELTERGHSVTAIDRYFFGRKPRVSYVMTEDIRTFEFAPGWDAVIDLAGLSNDASAEIDRDLTLSINLEGGRRLATLAKAAGVRRYVYSSSCSVYGQGRHPGLKETDELAPVSLYAETKVRVEDHLRQLAAPGFEPVILRNATVFGVAPRMRFDLAVNVMTMRAWKDGVIYVMGGGHQMRPFVHVADVVRAFVCAIEAPAAQVSNQTFNVGYNSMNLTIEQLAGMVREYRNPEPKVHYIPDNPDLRSYHVNFDKIRGLLDFRTVDATTVDQGIVQVCLALVDGTISADDPTTNTLGWYKQIMEWDRRLSDLKLDGRLL